MKILGSTKLDFDDVIIRPKSSGLPSRSDIDLRRLFNKFPHSKRYVRCIPIMASNMDTIGTFKMADSLTDRGWITCLHKHYTIDKLIDYYTVGNRVTPHWTSPMGQLVWYSLGIKDHDLNKLKTFITHTGFCPNLCIDVANGYTDYFVDRVAEIRSISPKSIIMAGNVATSEQVERIIRQGKADIVKVGIGPGSVCTTRLVTGVGYPQLSAILESSDAAHGSSRGYICADGGCKTSGDIVKAFGANADFVMLGSMLAGADECDGEWEYDEIVSYQDCGPDLGHVGGVKTWKKKRLKYYGMSSYTAKNKYGGNGNRRASEGKAVYVDYKGPVNNICHQIEGGVFSACSMIGAEKIKDIGRCTTFIKVNRTHNTFYESNNLSSTEEFRDSE